MPDQPREPGELVQSSAAVGGALAGTALTLVAGPWVGSAAGELTARVLLRVGAEIEKRLLAPRQEKRIADAYAAAAGGVSARLQAGSVLREDGFFAETEDDGGPAGELLEGVLLTAADAWEQRKVPYIGHMFAGVSFDATVSVPDANYLLKLSAQLTYRQLVLLAFWQHVSNFSSASMIRYIGSRTTPWTLYTASATLQAETEELASAGLIGVRRSDGTTGASDPTWDDVADTGKLKDAPLPMIHLTPLGQELYRLMGLDAIPGEEIDEIVAALRGKIRG